MNLSENGRRFIENHEGCVLHAYQDGGGVWTIGYGHTDGVPPGMTCTQEEADAWFVSDAAPCAEAVSRLVTVPLNQGQFDALVSFAFNVGVGALATSTLLRLLNRSDYAGAAGQFGRWVHDAAGNVEPGLVTRRADEKAMFLGGGA